MFIYICSHARDEYINFDSYYLLTIQINVHFNVKKNNCRKLFIDIQLNRWR